MFAFRLVQKKFQNKVSNKSWPFGTKFYTTVITTYRRTNWCNENWIKHNEFKINDDCPYLGSVSIVSNKQSIYTGVILIVRGSPWQAPGRPLLPVCQPLPGAMWWPQPEPRHWRLMRLGRAEQAVKAVPASSGSPAPDLASSSPVTSGNKWRGEADKLSRLSASLIMLVLRLRNSYTLWFKLWPGGFFVDVREWESKQFWSHDPLPPTQLVTAPSHCHSTANYCTAVQYCTAWEDGGW